VGDDLGDARVRQRRRASRTVDERDGARRRQLRALHEPGAALADEAIERLLHIGHPAALDQRPRQVWTPEVLAAGEALDLRQGDRHADGDQPSDHLLHARAALHHQRAGQTGQGGVGRIDEVTEHVDLASEEHRRELDARDDLHARRATRLHRCGQPIDGVVVGDRELGDACLARQTHQLGRRVLTIGGGRVAVQIDHGWGNLAQGGPSLTVREGGS
jgi:hypothetical protein